MNAMQTATISATIERNAKNYGGKKETVAKYVLIGLNREAAQMEVVLEIRVYMGRSKSASIVYASIWTQTAGGYRGGTGKAGGGGYHKESAAIAAAIRSAGITLSDDIADRGDSAVSDAILAIGRALGYTDMIIV